MNSRRGFFAMLLGAICAPFVWRRVDPRVVTFTFPSGGRVFFTPVLDTSEDGDFTEWIVPADDVGDMSGDVYTVVNGPRR